MASLTGLTVRLSPSTSVDGSSKFCQRQNWDRYMRLDRVEVGISSY